MKIIIKMLRSLIEVVQQDLSRPHPFALERVGFLSGRVGTWSENSLVILLHGYQPVADEDYEENDSVGAMMASSAIRKALQYTYTNKAAMFHVHRHDHRGRPAFSRVDLLENSKFVPNFWHVCPSYPHGALLLSLDSACGMCWCPTLTNAIPITEILVVGAPMRALVHEQ